MTHSLSPALSVGHWLLPWVIAVFASAAIAYAISGTLGATSAKPSSSVTRQSCPPIGNGYGSYVDSNIVAASRAIACGHGAIQGFSQ